ncbi:hypothetical protein [Nonomuraea zeae]|uniref:Tyr recombinase domain-containing protein n=1 Tax=Nonomuraea zeae TaxID=1642303 RepID=A0A5S4FN13_9ACTN|nr:hypothetical protein [Nonomuraea zeae]TMR22127.1 hypothetical protein ETD85_49860 [Nonomuraea zeae]
MSTRGIIAIQPLGVLGRQLRGVFGQAQVGQHAVLIRHPRRALQHLAEAGRTAPELQAESRHQSLSSLGRYLRLGEETSARMTAEHDPAARRHTR